MEAYNSNSYPTSKSSYLTQNPDHEAANEGLKNGCSFQSHSSLQQLHSVRKKSSQSKQWKKATVAPPLPTPIRVYQVDVLNFRELVQQLTGAPEFKPQLHPPHQFVQNPLLQNRDIAAAAAAPSSVSNNWHQMVRAQSQEINSGSEKQPGLLELNLSSPSSNYGWCSSLP